MARQDVASLHPRYDCRLEKKQSGVRRGILPDGHEEPFTRNLNTKYEHFDPTNALYDELIARPLFPEPVKCMADGSEDEIYLLVRGRQWRGDRDQVADPAYDDAFFAGELRCFDAKE
jgi:hypothetical protein